LRQCVLCHLCERAGLRRITPRRPAWRLTGPPMLP
jgi:hypothetical protein